MKPSHLEISLIVLDVEGVVLDDGKLVSKHMTNHTILLQDYGKDVIAVQPRWLDIQEIPIAQWGLHRDRFIKLVNHLCSS
jgi:hypothetical protein